MLLIYLCTQGNKRKIRHNVALMNNNYYWLPRDTDINVISKFLVKTSQALRREKLEIFLLCLFNQ